MGWLRDASQLILEATQLIDIAINLHCLTEAGFLLCQDIAKEEPLHA